MKYPSIFFSVVLALVSLLLTPSNALAVIQNLNGATGMTQTFQGDPNMIISTNPMTNIHSLVWQGLLPISRGGTGAGSFTTGSIPFIWSGVFSQDNSNFYWDDTNNRLGIGNSSPTSTLEVSGTAKVTSLNSTSDSTINSLNVGLGGGSVASNTSFGKDALVNANSNSRNDTALGHRALASAGSSADSTAVGYYALESSTTGSNNAAVGSFALKENTVGSYNTAVGTDALRLNSGSFNTSTGYQALGYNNGGSNNIAIGFRSGNFQSNFSALTSPENSIYIGWQAKGYDDNDSNSIVIGADATGAGANTTVIGNSDMTDIYFGSASGLADTHATRLFLGSSSIPGCIVMGDINGGVGYITLVSGVLTASTTPPTACQ